MMNVFSECQKFVKEETDAVDMFAFLMGPKVTLSDPGKPPPSNGRLVKKASLPSNTSVVSTSKPSLCLSQGKLQPLNKDITKDRYMKQGQTDKQYASCAGLSRVMPKRLIPKVSSKNFKKEPEEVNNDDAPKQLVPKPKIDYNKKCIPLMIPPVGNFQTPLIPNQPQLSKIHITEGPSPYDGQWATNILKGYFKVELKKRDHKKWVVQRVKDDDSYHAESIIHHQREESVKAIKSQEVLFRQSKAGHREQIPSRDPAYNKRLDEYMSEASQQKVNSSLKAYRSKKLKHRKQQPNLIAQQVIQAAFEEPTFMPLFDLNFEKNYTLRTYIAQQQGQLGQLGLMFAS